MTTISEQLSNYSNYSDVLIPVTTLPLLDILLCSMISSKARWFQLHAVTNLIITIIILTSCHNSVTIINKYRC